MQDPADCVVLALIHFPTLNLRMPEAPVSGRSSEQLSAGGLVPEVTSGRPGRVWQQQQWGHVAPRGHPALSWGSLGLGAWRRPVNSGRPGKCRRWASAANLDAAGARLLK